MNKILSDAISTFGVEMQTIKAIEECGELIQALSRTLLGDKNSDNVREEIADVEIMCEQLRIMYDTNDIQKNIESIKESKIDRLELRMQKIGIPRDKKLGRPKIIDREAYRKQKEKELESRVCSVCGSTDIKMNLNESWYISAFV